MPTSKPTYTQIPNDLLGNIETGNKCLPGLMAELTESQLKVYLAVCRITFGYHRQERRLSLSQMMILTGLSRQSVLDAAKSLVDLGMIQQEKDGGVTLWRVWIYENEVVQNLDQSKIKTEVVQNLDQSSLKFRPPSKKETKKETKKEPGPLTQKLLDICHLKLDRLTGRQEKNLIETMNILVKNINITVEDLEQFEIFWKQSWRTGSPTLLQIPETWGEFEQWQDSQPKTRNGRIVHKIT